MKNETAVGGVSSSRGLSEGETFDILKNDRRREIIRYLARTDQVVTVSEIARTIAAIEPDGSDRSTEPYRRIYVSLRQTHLPKLATTGIIDYDEEAKTIRPGPRLGDLTPYVLATEEATETGGRARAMLGLGFASLLATSAGVLFFAEQYVGRLYFGLFLVYLVPSVIVLLSHVDRG